MIDIDAIREEHRPLYNGYTRVNHCVKDRQEWPCDTAVVLAALDAERTGLVSDFVDELRRARAERDAAIEREARLRAALQGLDVPFQWLQDHYPKAMVEMPTHVLRRYDAARAALATTTEGEHE